MHRSILKINISNELDIVLAYKRAMQLCERLGISIGNQTKFSTAISEICRNVIDYVGNGQIQFGLFETNGPNYLEAIVSDRGRGIGNIEHLLNRPAQNSQARGYGIANARKLVDYFHIESDFEKGTKVTLRIRLPHNSPTVTKSIADAWTQELNMESVSPYDEIKKQNMQLLEVLDTLREKNEVTQQQLEEIGQLNERLQVSNKNIQQLSDERDKQNKLLQKINNELDAFAHTVSHDLRAPLQNITGLTSALEDCIESEKIAEAKELFPMLHKQAQRMDAFITNVLAYSLAGQNNIPKTETDVKELVQEVVNLLGFNHAVTLKMPDILPVLITEKVFLHQVFSNILNNAVKYHDLNELPVIQINYKLTEDLIQFSVEDNGPGILEENKKRIFEMYETLDNGNIRTDSTGLGLSIVSKIIRKKGGKVWVESEGRGSQFIFTWPISELAVF